MGCRVCAWLCKWFCPPELASDGYWAIIHRWDEEFARDWEPWDEDAEIRSRSKDAVALLQSTPSLALARLEELADAGSAFAMRWVGTLYSGKYGIEKDDGLAESYFLRALEAGSWMSTISYSRSLFIRGAHEEWRSTLNDGVDKGFIPAMFWFANHEYTLSPSRQTAEEIRPMLLRAAEAGHPGARMMYAQLMARGRFGLGQVTEGWKMLRVAIAEFRSSAMPS
jgi:hypothetical protein